MPIRLTWGMRLGSGGPAEAREHAGSPTVWAKAMRCAAATAVGDVYQVVVTGPLGSGRGVAVDGLVRGAGALVAGRVVVREGRGAGWERVGAGDVCVDVCVCVGVCVCVCEGVGDGRVG
ncbi:hypothetical protein WN71_007765 [Streptomyces mangrovisoli]|uniref:Uncharacterized protein n=1 Tax=Streptomyces mangrovisoli TaxID=1428628 RepID=A0A1J4P139_9ACTN|nr:hypothetical protein WN71_007765 [Streptomyces mangrovisoli]